MSEEGLEYRYVGVIYDRVLVSINRSRYHTKTVNEVNRLLDELKANIPFEFSVVAEPCIRILRSNRRKGMLSVEMVIRHKLDKETMVTQLRSRRFYAGEF